MMWQTVAIIFLLYIFLIFIFTRLIIPNLGFTKRPLPKKTPLAIRKEINRLKKKSKSKKAYLKNTYNLLKKKYHGGHIATITKLNYCFITDLDKLWSMKGYLPCHTHNYLLRVFLIHSHLFSEQDIQIKTTFVDFNIHQYSKVRVGNEWINIDIWGAKFGVQLGKHAFLIR